MVLISLDMGSFVVVCTRSTSTLRCWMELLQDAKVDSVEKLGVSPLSGDRIN